MRTLAPAPEDALDPTTLEPRFGSYRGGLSRIEAGRAARGPLAGLARIARHKRWLFLVIARDPVIVALTVLRFGYASNAFAFVYHTGERRMLAESSSLGPAFAAAVGDTSGRGVHARFRFGSYRTSVVAGPGTGPGRQGETACEVRLSAKRLELSARLDATVAPPAIAAVASVPGGFVATEKRALLSATGEAVVAGRRFVLDGGLAGCDYTQGLLPRHTAWRWAFALGLAKGGEPFALNLVEGHVGEAECAAWFRGDVHPLAEGRFQFDCSRPLDPWRVATRDGAVDLVFSPGGMHAERKNLGIIRSRFVQPVGTYSGTVRLGDRSIELEAMPGVVEDQNVLW